MAAPWEKYQKSAEVSAAPWERYGNFEPVANDIREGETEGAAKVRRIREARLNVDREPKPLEAVLGGMTKSMVIDPVLGTAKLLSGGRVGQEASQRYEEESQPYRSASPIGFGVGQVAGSLVPATTIMKGTSAIPSFANNMLAQNVATGTIMGLLTPENTGKTGIDFYKEQAKEGGIGAALGLIPTAGEELGKFLRKPQTAEMANAINQARASGYVIPPTQANPTMFNKAIEGISGKAATSQNASARNQLITNKLATQALGLSDDAVLTSKTLEDIRKTAGKAYENLDLQGTIKTSPKFIQALDNIKPYKDAMQAAKDFPEDLANPIIKVVDSLKRPNFDVSSAVSKISVLRNEADMAYKAGNTDLGKANKEASKILENTIESYLANSKQTDLLDKFKEARQLIAKTYSVQKAVNPVTGTVDAKKLASQLKAGKPLSGELKEIAEFSSRFPKATQTTEAMGSLPQISPFDYVAGGIGSLATGNLAPAAVVAGRPVLRELALSSPVQNRLIQQAPQQASELARLLMIQPANQLIGEK